MDPKCPACQAQGIAYVESAALIPRNGGADRTIAVVYCGKCGHVYGVVSTSAAAPALLPDEMGAAGATADEASTD